MGKGEVMPPWEKYSGEGAGPWAKYGQLTQGPDLEGLAGGPGAPNPQGQSYQGAVLPFSSDARGNVSFDSNAGIVGAVKRAFTAPGDVLAGKIDPYSEEGASRAREMAGIITPASAAMSAGERAIPGVLKNLGPRKVEPPTTEALKKATTEGYEKARNMGVDYSSDAVKNLSQAVQRRLENEDGLFAESAPESFRILQKLQEAPADSVASLAGLDTARKSFSGIAQANSGLTGNKREKYAAERAIKQLDEFISSPRQEDVVSGPAAAAGEVIKEARGNAAAGFRSEKLEAIDRRVDLSAAAANSGLNIDNKIRQQATNLLLRPKDIRGFSAGEVKLLENLVEGTKSINTLRYTGNLLGGGGGLAQQITGLGGAAAGSAVTGSPWGLLAGVVPPAVGAISRVAENRMALRALDKIEKTVRMRSPLYRQMVKDAPQEAKTMEGRAALLRTFLTRETQDEE